MFNLLSLRFLLNPLKCIENLITFGLDFGGGGGNTTSTVTQSSIPDWLKPQTEAMLGSATQQIFGATPVTDSKGNTTYNINGVNPYIPYSTNPQDYYAGFSPMQQQSFAQAANLQMPGGYAQGTNLATAAGYGGLQSGEQSLGYGGMGAQSGQLGQQAGIQGGQFYGGMGSLYGQQAANVAGNALGYGRAGAGYGDLASQLGLQGLQSQQYGMGIGNQAQNYAAQAAAAGQNYGNLITNPSAIQAYMSPYQQAVTDVAKAGALRDYQVQQTMRQANAAKAGAYGGSRQAIENAEAQRNLNTQLQGIEAQGQQNAYNQALASINQQQQLGLSGLQGAQQGLGTALSGGQLGLSGIGQAISGQNAAMQGQQIGLGGASAANQAYQTGIQGAGVGLQGVNAQLAGTQQGMQGAGYGLQGVQGAQQGYQLANTAGQNLSNIGTNQLAAAQGLIGLQNQYGQQQQAYQQNLINAAIQNYGNAQQYPMQQLSMYNALLRGYSTPTSASTTYAPAPSALSQIGGLGAAGLGAYMASKKEGGVIKAYKSGGLVDLAVSNALEGV